MAASSVVLERCEMHHSANKGLLPNLNMAARTHSKERLKPFKTG